MQMAGNWEHARLHLSRPPAESSAGVPLVTSPPEERASVLWVSSVSLCPLTRVTHSVSKVIQINSRGAQFGFGFGKLVPQTYIFGIVRMLGRFKICPCVCL